MDRDLWSTLPKCLQHLIVAQAIELHPASATALLSSSKSFNHAACKSLYQELYILDDEQSFDYPPPNTRVATVLANLNDYAAFVRMITVIPKPIIKQTLSTRSDVSQESPKLNYSKEPNLTPLQIGKIIATFPNLEAFVWASDRVPPPQFCELINLLCPALEALFVRPAFPSILLGPEHRWATGEIIKLNKLKRLSVSHISGEGVRRITSLLEISPLMTHLTIDSQFADDNLLRAMGEMKALTHVVLRCSGTKVTDKGLAALLEGSQSLKYLKLDELEGRLSRNVWQNIEFLPNTLEHFKIIYAEEGPHHSWVTDHMDGIFHLFPLSGTTLKTFSITTLVPECMYVKVQDGDATAQSSNNGSFQVKRTYQNACDERIAARKLPAGALEKIINHGKQLETLELDMYEVNTDDVKKIMDACRSLQHLRILLDFPLSKLFCLSSSFVQMTKLEKLSLSLTEAHCPLPGIVQITEDEKTVSRLRSNSHTHSTSKSSELPSIGVQPGEVSPASTYASLPSVSGEQEVTTPDVSTTKQRQIFRSVNNGKGLLIINTNLSCQIDKLGCKNDLISNTNVTEATIPPKREIRKLARRCPSLRTINWYGRLGKGEWSIIPAATTLQTGIIFTPIYVIEDRDRDQSMELETGADVEKFIVSRRIVNLTDVKARGQEEKLDKKMDICAELEKKLSQISQSLLDDIEFPTIETGTSRGGSSSPVSLHACSSRDTSATMVSSPTLSNKSPKIPIRYTVGLPTSHNYCNFVNPWDRDENRFSNTEQRTYAEAINKAKDCCSPEGENTGLRARSSSQVVDSWNTYASNGVEDKLEMESILVPSAEKSRDQWTNSALRRGGNLPKKPTLTSSRRASQTSS